MSEIRIPPADIATEKSVLGSMIISTDALYAGLERLHIDDFYLASHKIIYKTMKEMVISNIPVDIVTLNGNFTGDNLEASGGISYLSELTEHVATSRNINAYVDILAGVRMRRSLVVAAKEILAIAYEGGVPIIDLKASCERIMTTALSGDCTSLEPRRIGSMLSPTFAEIERATQSNTGISGITSGYQAIDDYTAGWHGGELIVIAARPGMGKTALMMNLAINAFLVQQISSLIFSVEMPAIQLTQRALSMQSGTNLHSLRSGRLSQADHVNLRKAADDITRWEIYIDDTPGMKIVEMKSKIRRAKLENNIGIVFIDYLQLMGNEKSEESRNLQVEYNSRSLKAISKEYNVPVVALSQLSRECERRIDKRPMLSDLRDSGAIEQDADLVMFVFRECIYNKAADKNAAEIIFAKQRNGSTGTINMRFKPQNASFENVVDSEEW